MEDLSFGLIAGALSLADALEDSAFQLDPKLPVIRHLLHSAARTIRELAEPPRIDTRSDESSKPRCVHGFAFTEPCFECEKGTETFNQRQLAELNQTQYEVKPFKPEEFVLPDSDPFAEHPNLCPHNKTGWCPHCNT